MTFQYFYKTEFLSQRKSKIYKKRVQLDGQCAMPQSAGDTVSLLPGADNNAQLRLQCTHKLHQ